MIPGKKQEGPVSLVANTYREALPALAFLFKHLAVESSIRGRFHRNVKDNRIPVLEGSFPPRMQSIGERMDSSSISPFWLFQSPGLSVLTCSLLSEDTRNGSTLAVDPLSETGVQDRAMALQTCLDNIVFRLGKEAVGGLDIFLDPYLEYSFAAGNPAQAEQLRQEIVASFQPLQTDQLDQTESI